MAISMQRKLVIITWYLCYEKLVDKQRGSTGLSIVGKEDGIRGLRSNCESRLQHDWSLRKMDKTMLVITPKCLKLTRLVASEDEDGNISDEISRASMRVS